MSLDKHTEQHVAEWLGSFDEFSENTQNELVKIFTAIEFRKESNHMAEILTIDIKEVAARMKLATLTTGAPRFRRLHKTETKAVNQKHGTGEAAKVSVLQCSHPALTEINAIQGAARLEHYRLTLPSVQDGLRLLAVGKEFEHAEKMSEAAIKQRVKVDQLAADGCFVGGAQFDTDRVRLNGLFEERAWPVDASEMRRAFVFQTRYLGVPTDGAWSEWLEESSRAADAEVRDRLENALKHVAERCSSDGRLFQSIFTNLQDLLDLVPSFDVSGRYEAIVKAAKEVASFNAESIRDNKKTRTKIAERASEIGAMFGDPDVIAYSKAS